MKKLIVILALICASAFLALGQNGDRPVVTLTRPQVTERVADVKRRTGKTIDLYKMGQPVADPSRRGGRVKCRTLTAEEWYLVFSQETDAGGTVCTRG